MCYIMYRHSIRVQARRSMAVVNNSMSTGVLFVYIYIERERDVYNSIIIDILNI